MVQHDDDGSDASDEVRLVFDQLVELVGEQQAEFHRHCCALQPCFRYGEDSLDPK